ncbi:ATP-binding protein, partial [Halorubrum sp. CBA1125]|uniref:ATP-binding protein n=1 Tax=Halorubrum sp. CBA1125 TaxID=2668072 RepID=UPI00374441EE
EGIGGDATAEPGSPVELPVVDVLTGRSFITGKSGSGKSNTASVVIENLLDNGFPVMIVDTDGEYYGLKEEYEILHAGADDECDIVVSPEHAEKLANLALEQNVPIILDVSGYLEEDTADELLLEVTRQLFAKEKRLKKPFLLVVEECHEYIPEGGGMDETGKMLIKVGKRGRKHGLGIVGISQRPADVKKDFITQCDWLCWHRLTWDNDTTVVGRILGSKYANAVEDLADGEAFLMTDWDESIRRIQFHRKQTFDAGATPGLDDFERPELKSVSGDLVDELQSISDEKARRESELADLRQELEKKRQRIHELERELEEARDLSDMADQFAQALLGKAEAPYRGGDGRSVAAAKARDREREQADLDGYDGETSPETDDARADEESVPVGDADGDPDRDDAHGDTDRDGDADGDAGAAPPEDVEPVTRADVAESALRFDEAVELGTREAVIEELRSRVESLSDLSRGMLRHYRREGVSDPVAAHIDAGGDGDAGHAYSRHRPIRRAGLIRHAGRGHYAYAIPDLIREAYADRLDEESVSEIVRAVETAFVPSAERSYPPTAGPDASSVTASGRT